MPRIRIASSRSRSTRSATVAKVRTTTPSPDWRHERIAAYERLDRHLGPNDTGAFLVWGDPTLYDGTLAILDDVRANGHVEFAVEVIPGISSVSALAARHGWPSTAPAKSILITTGRRLARDGVPEAIDNVVVMLDAHDAWRGLGDDYDVWWSAFVGHGR